VDADDGVPLRLVHVEEHPVAQDPGVVDEDIQAPELVVRLVDHLLRGVPIGDVAAVRDGFTAHGFDLVHDRLSNVRGVAGVVALLAEVVHDDLRTLACELERVTTSDAAAPAGDDDDTSFADTHQLFPAFCLYCSRTSRRYSFPVS
jgi:hypothetical protein